MKRDRLELSISKEEGFSTVPYRDTKKLWTSGKGRNLHTMRLAEVPLSIETIGDLLNWMADPLTAEGWFQEDVDEAIEDAKRWLGFMWNDLSSVRQETVVEMMFQMGYGSVSKFKKMRAAIADARWAAAADEMLDSQWAKVDTPERAQRLAERFRQG